MRTAQEAYRFGERLGREMLQDYDDLLRMDSDCDLAVARTDRSNGIDPIAIEAQMMGGDAVWGPYA